MLFCLLKFLLEAQHYWVCLISMLGHRHIQHLRHIATTTTLFNSIAATTDNQQKLSTIETKSQLVQSNTIAPPIKPWPQKLTPKRLCSIIFRQQNLDLALQIFRYAGKHHPDFQNNYDTYHSIIQKIIQARAFKHIPLLLNEMRNSKLKCEEDLFIALIRSYGIASKPKEAIKTFFQINDFDVQRSVKSFNTLLDALVQSKDYDSVQTMFKSCQEKFCITPNVFTCNILLKALCRKDDVEGAVKVFDEMPESGMVPNVATYTTIVRGYVNRGDMAAAKRVFNQIIDRGLLPDATTYTVLMDGFCKLDRIDDATKVMDEMAENGVKPNDVTYSVMIEAFCKEKKLGEAVNMVNEMLDKKCFPSPALCCRLIDVLCEEKKVDEASDLWNMILTKYCAPDDSISTTLIHCLCKQGKVWEAKKWFDDLNNWSVSNLLTYNTMIAAMCDKGEFCEAGKLWDDMVEKWSDPNAFSFNMFIKGYCKLGVVKQGIRVLDEMLGMGFAPDQFTFAILIQGLCDSQRKDDTAKVLDIAGKWDIRSDSWRVLLLKLVANREVTLEKVLSENAI